MKKIIESNSFKRFEKFIENNKLSHSYLICGENQFSTFEFSKAVALKLACDKSLPCLECENCKKILSGFHPDVLVYPKEKSFLVSDSKSIIENVDIKPMSIKYKIFIINDIDNATVQSQNKLLKTIEESPANVIFLFNTTNKNNVLQTIVSRTQVFEIENYEEINYKKTVEYEFVFDLMKNMKSSKNVIKYSVKFAQKNNFVKNLMVLQNIFEELLYAKAGKCDDIEIDFLASEYTVQAISEINGLITLAKRQFDANVNSNIITDNLLLKILEVKYLWNTKK